MELDRPDNTETMWRRVTDGPDAGRIRLRWLLDAIPVPGGDAYPVAICPRCGAMVHNVADVLGDNRALHESWHAATDYPIPDDLEGVGLPQTR